MQYNNTFPMSSQRCNHLHHHHHHHCHGVHSYCAFHNHFFHCHCHCHPQPSNFVTPLPLPPQDSQSFVPFPVGNNSNVVAAEHKAADGVAAQISQELEHLDQDQEEDEEPIFVLTDEWRDFFAKSEARRQQEKKLRKKGKK